MSREYGAPDGGLFAPAPVPEPGINDAPSAPAPGAAPVSAVVVDAFAPARAGAASAGEHAGTAVAPAAADSPGVAAALATPFDSAWQLVLSHPLVLALVLAVLCLGVALGSWLAQLKAHSGHTDNSKDKHKDKDVDKATLKGTAQRVSRTSHMHGHAAAARAQARQRAAHRHSQSHAGRSPAGAAAGASPDRGGRGAGSPPRHDEGPPLVEGFSAEESEFITTQRLRCDAIAGELGVLAKLSYELSEETRRVGTPSDAVAVREKAYELVDMGNTLCGDAVDRICGQLLDIVTAQDILSGGGARGGEGGDGGGAISSASRGPAAAASTPGKASKGSPSPSPSPPPSSSPSSSPTPARPDGGDTARVRAGRECMQVLRAIIAQTQAFSQGVGALQEVERRDPTDITRRAREEVQRAEEERQRQEAEAKARAAKLSAALLEACDEGAIGPVRLLLADGADVNGHVAGGMRRTPLHAVAERKHARLALELLRHGADATAANARGFEPLHVAASSGAAGVAEAILRADASVVDRRTQDGRTPLHIACAAGDADIAELLLRSGADGEATVLIDARAGAGAGRGSGASFPDVTAMHMAAEAGSVGVVSTLLRYGVRPGPLAATPGGGSGGDSSASEAEAEAGYSGAAPPRRTRCAPQPIELARSGGHTEVERLLQHELDRPAREAAARAAREEAKRRKANEAALMSAVVKGDVAAVKALLTPAATSAAGAAAAGSAAGAANGKGAPSGSPARGSGSGSGSGSDFSSGSGGGTSDASWAVSVNCADDAGVTPLHMACFFGQEAIVKLLLARGAAIKVRAENGKSPADIARTMGHAGILALLRGEAAARKRDKDRARRMSADSGGSGGAASWADSEDAPDEALALAAPRTAATHAGAGAAASTGAGAGTAGAKRTSGAEFARDDFTGVWTVAEDSDTLAPILTELGIGWVGRKLIMSIEIVSTVTMDADSVTIEDNTKFGATSNKLPLNAGDDAFTVLQGEKGQVKMRATLHDGTLILTTVLDGDQGITTDTRRMVDANTMSQVLELSKQGRVRGSVTRRFLRDRSAAQPPSRAAAAATQAKHREAVAAAAAAKASTDAAAGASGGGADEGKGGGGDDDGDDDDMGSVTVRLPSGHEIQCSPEEAAKITQATAATVVGGDTAALAHLAAVQQRHAVPGSGGRAEFTRTGEIYVGTVELTQSLQVPRARVRQGPHAGVIAGRDDSDAGGSSSVEGFECCPRAVVRKGALHVFFVAQATGDDSSGDDGTGGGGGGDVVQLYERVAGAGDWAHRNLSSSVAAGIQSGSGGLSVLLEAGRMHVYFVTAGSRRVDELLWWNKWVHVTPFTTAGGDLVPPPAAAQVGAPFNTSTSLGLRYTGVDGAAYQLRYTLFKGWRAARA